MKNRELADMFETMADVMEIQGANPFRVNSYRKVARILGDLTEDIEKVSEEGRLDDLPGIGSSSAEKIQQYLDEGTMDRYEEVMSDFPEDALEMLQIPGLGPKTVARFLNEKGIESVDELAEAIEDGSLAGMEGLGAKTFENIKKGIRMVREQRGRTKLGTALPIAQEIIEKLTDRCDIPRAQAAGSLRRHKETVGDVDILVTTGAAESGEDAVSEEIPGGKEIIQEFTALDMVDEVIAAGQTKGSVRTRQGLQVDVRVVRPESFGAALQYFTGSKAHNVHIRGIAVDRDLKINEYGVFKGDERVAGETEEDVYTALDLPWIPPELREDRGEVEAAAEDGLPHLITVDDLRGDLHSHTSYSDGAASVLEMATAARDMGYEFLGLTDHSVSLSVTQGPDEEGLRRKKEEIDRAMEELDGFTILAGSEVDIFKDGSLDYNEEILEWLDLVIAAVHTHFGLDEKEMTERVVKAVSNPHVDILAHPTGRLINEREPYALDMNAVVEACAENGVALELNSFPDRLDITDTVCRQAKETGVKVAIDTDSHHPSHLQWIKVGVGTARRGWLEPDDVLNCMSAKELLEYLNRDRS